MVHVLNCENRVTYGISSEQRIKTTTENQSRLKIKTSVPVCRWRKWGWRVGSDCGYMNETMTALSLSTHECYKCTPKARHPESHTGRTPSHSVWFLYIIKKGWMEVDLNSTGSFKKPIATTGGMRKWRTKWFNVRSFHLHCNIWMCDLESIFSSDFLACCDHRALFGMEALARMLGSVAQREGGKEGGRGRHLGRVLQQLIKAAAQVFRD